MTVKLLTEHHLEFLSLKGGCTGSSKSTHVNMSHCWKSHALAHYMIPGRLASSANSSCVLTVRLRTRDLDYRYNLGDKVQGLQMSYYAVFIY